jgi:hypothetical protein
MIFLNNVKVILLVLSNNCYLMILMTLVFKCNYLLFGKPHFQTNTPDYFV